jgi:hypothetical protein
MAEEHTKAELENMLNQLQPGALPGPEAFSVEPTTVPLVIYIDDKKHIAVEAAVVDGKVHVRIGPRDWHNLERMINTGFITSVSITFKTAGPAHKRRDEVPGEITPDRSQ